MALALVFFGLIFTIIASIQLTGMPKGDSALRESGGYTSTTTSLVKPYKIQYNGRDSVDENRTMARNADTAAVRVCRQLSYEMKVAYTAGDLTCADYHNSPALYAFIGPAGTSGSIDTLYSGATSSTLDCAVPQNYARYLFARALPQSMIAGKNVQYNLTAVVNDKSDPCGFREIIY